MSNIKLVHSGGNSVSLTTPGQVIQLQIVLSNYWCRRDIWASYCQTDGSGALSFATGHY